MPQYAAGLRLVLTRWLAHECTYIAMVKVNRLSRDSSVRMREVNFEGHVAAAQPAGELCSPIMSSLVLGLVASAAFMTPHPCHSRFVQAGPLRAALTASTSDGSSQNAMEFLASGGLAAGLAYTTISAAWYGVGLVLVLARPSAAPTAALSPAARAMRRVGRAWVVTFAASQVTTPWRAAGAAALSPVVDSALRRIRDALGVKTKLVPAIIYAAVVICAFGAGVASLIARELVLHL